MKFNLNYTVLCVHNQLTMKTLNATLIALLLVTGISCTQNENAHSGNTDAEVAQQHVGQSGVQDSESSPNIVQVAVGSKDHSTLVTAVKKAELVDALSNAGPFTVFAPVNAAFDKLEAGTVENLLKPENKDALSNILEYHVSLGVYKPEALTDGKVLGQVNGGNIKISNENGEIVVNGSAKVVGTVMASNGIIHVIDGVLLPQ